VFFIGSSGIPNSSSSTTGTVFGELYVTYRVRLFNPQPTSGSSVVFSSSSSLIAQPWLSTVVTGNMPGLLSSSTDSAGLFLGSYVGVGGGGPLSGTLAVYGTLAVGLTETFQIYDALGNVVPGYIRSDNVLVSSTGEFSVNIIFGVDQAPAPIYIQFYLADSAGTAVISSSKLVINRTATLANFNTQVALPFNISSGLPKWTDCKFERQITKNDIQKYISDSLTKLNISDHSTTPTSIGGFVHCSEPPIMILSKEIDQKSFDRQSRGWSVLL